MTYLTHLIVWYCILGSTTLRKRTCRPEAVNIGTLNCMAMGARTQPLRFFSNLLVLINSISAPRVYSASPYVARQMHRNNNNNRYVQGSA